MTIRKIPALDLGVIAPSAVELSATALARWDETIQAADESDNVISIMGAIGEDIWGEGITAKRIGAQLRALDRDVIVNINSPGGNMFEGLAIYNLFRQHPYFVEINVIGVAASAASVVAMAGDEVRIAKAGFIMIHNATLPDAGNRHDKREIADKLEQFDTAMAGLYADRTGLTRAKIAAMMDEETFLTGEEAVAQKFADALLPGDAVKHGPKAEMTPLRRIDAALAKGERMPRAERRALFQEITAKPRAGDEIDTPGAVETAVDDGTAGISLALARLKLMRA
ncbi:Clp protease ClpP [Sphingomonas histidinilytica]|uniref:head maturation protease, ClpP-related n=1 Tax=Rhizorhabdus histidinilytica TaxID=439228 RepID=UPI001ADACFFA|nr:head maturation protease, ClpP-related [Rhizorhabdus histidinilytica]MBO9377683.1 Clp protease ClpP [Rhizorhabdus histidinilytica]